MDIYAEVTFVIAVCSECMPKDMVPSVFYPCFFTCLSRLVIGLYTICGKWLLRRDC